MFGFVFPSVFLKAAFPGTILTVSSCPLRVGFWNKEPAAIQMATLADSFLNDLQELSDDEAEEEELEADQKSADEPVGKTAKKIANFSGGQLAALRNCCMTSRSNSALQHSATRLGCSK